MVTDSHDLAQVIGELRSFASQQTVTNAHMLEELKKISERMTSFSEVGAGLAEYRKTLHERFGRIHEMIGDIDHRIEKVENKIDGMEDIIAMWRGQMKTLIIVIGVAGTIISSLLSTYGGLLLKALAHATP